MEFFGQSRIRKIQEKLFLDFGKKRCDAMSSTGKTVNEVWNNTKHATFKGLLRDILRESLTSEATLDRFSEIKNIAIRKGFDIIQLSKTDIKTPCLQRSSNTKTSRTHFNAVVGCGNIFFASEGIDVKSALKDARLGFINKLCSIVIESSAAMYQQYNTNIINIDESNSRDIVLDQASVLLMDALFANQTDELCKLMKMGHGTPFAECIEESLVPQEAKDAVAIHKSGSKGKWFIIRRVSKAVKHKKNTNFKIKEQSFDDLFSSIEERCTIDSGILIDGMWKGGEDQWSKDGQKLLQRINDGIKRMGILGFDGEGNGAYWQLAWLGENGIEALVLGPNFFPDELVKILKLPNVYILGVAVWEDVAGLSAESTGFKTVDLSILASDMPSFNKDKPGMASIFLDCTGVDISHLKKCNKGPLKGLRYEGWNNVNLSDVKVLYAALDAVVVFPVLYKVLQHWRFRYRTSESIQVDDISWDWVLRTVLGPLVNRIRIDGKKGYERGCEARDPLHQTAGLLGSMHVSDVCYSRKGKGKKQINKFSSDCKGFL